MDSDPSSAELDRSLLDLITVDIFQLIDGEWQLSKTLSSGSEGSEQLRLEDDFYLVNWHTSVPKTGGDFRIVPSVGGMEIGDVAVTLTKEAKKGKNAPAASNDGIVLSARGSLPIKVFVEAHPAIRARARTERDYSATDIAQVLLDEFGLTTEQVAQLLLNEDHDAPSVALALKDVYGLDAESAAAILKDVGYTAEQIGQALKDSYGSGALDATVILKSIGFEPIDVGFTLANIFDLSSQGTGQTMTDAGFSIDGVYAALRAVWTDLTTGDVVQLFYDIGWLAEEVGQFLWDGLGWTGDQIIDGLEADG